KASSSMGGAIAVSAQRNMREQQPPYRMPAGNGNTSRWLFWNRYMQPVVNAPTGAATNNIIQGETQDYREDFSAWLQEADISSFSILADPLLTLVTSSSTDKVIEYRI